jgi:hypothetical protein
MKEDDNEDSDFDSDESSDSSCSDDIGPSEHDRFEENFDMTKLDKTELALIQKIHELQKMYIQNQ